MLLSKLFFYRIFLYWIMLFLVVNLKAQPVPRNDSLYFTIKEFPIEDSIETIKYIEEIELDHLLYHRSSPYSGYDTVVVTKFDPRWKPKIELAYFNDSLYRCFLIPTSSLDHYDKIQWILSNNNQTTTIEIHYPFSNYGQNYFIGEISFNKKLHAIDARDPAVYFDKYARKILDSAQTKKNKKFEVLAQNKDKTKLRDSKIIRKARRWKRSVKNKWQRKRADKRMNEIHTRLRAIEIEDSILIAEQKLYAAQKNKIRTTFSFNLKNFPLYGKIFEEKHSLDFFKVYYETYEGSNLVDTLKQVKLAYNYLNDSLRRCFQFDVESANKYHYLFIHLTCPNQDEVHLRLPINYYPNRHFYLGELSPSNGTQNIRIGNNNEQDSDGRIMLKPIKIPRQWLPQKPKFIGKPNLFVRYSSGKGKKEAIVILNRDTLDVIPTSDSMRSQYYYNASSSSSPSYDLPFDIKIIHPDYPPYSHSQKVMQHPHYYLSNKRDSSYVKIGLSKFTYWDQKTITVVLNVPFPRYYYELKNGPDKERIKKHVEDSIKQERETVIKKICGLYQLKVKPNYYPPKMYFHPDFNLNHVFLLQRKDGRKFSLNQESWIGRLRDFPEVKKVMLPTTVETENELEGPHLSNSFYVKFKAYTTGERIEEIFKVCQIDKFHTPQTGFQSIRTYLCQGKKDQLIPKAELFKRLLDFEEVIFVQLINENYSDIRE